MCDILIASFLSPLFDLSEKFGETKKTVFEKNSFSMRRENF